MTAERPAYDTDATPLDRMVRAIVDEVDPEQVILFGSRARGDATAESDFDLVVVEAEPFGDGRSRYAEEARLYRALAGCGVCMDKKLPKLPEMESLQGGGSVFYAHLCKKAGKWATRP